MQAHFVRKLSLSVRLRNRRAENWLISALWLTLLLFVIASVSGQTTVFGPKTYTRTSGPPNNFTDNFSVSNLNGVFTLVVVNGDANGGHRVSSGEIKLNGVI